MTITLTPGQLRWLEAQVAAGHFPSIDEAVRLAVEDLMAATCEQSEEELAQLRQLIDAADADIAAGRVHHFASADELTVDIVARGERRLKAKT